jgi:HDOD domain
MNGEEVSLAKIAELVEFDQAIAAAILRMARSWAYAGSRPPETVRDPVVIANMVAKNIGVGLGAEGFNLTVDSECVRRLGLDFTRFARICLQIDTWLRELRAAQKSPARA